MKRWIFILVGALIASNGYWLYKTRMYDAFYEEMEYQQKIMDEAQGQLTRIANINVIGKTTQEVKTLLEPDISVTAPSGNTGCLDAGHICLHVDNDGVVATVF